MNTNSKVNILMATYNGETYITEQLDSLLTQTHSNWELLIRDDGSTDQTVNIIKDYITRDDRISLITNTTDIKGACSNFSALLSFIVKKKDDARYIMFSDQDDIWKCNKIEMSLAAIMRQEEDSVDSPFLVYTDLELIDASGKTISGQLKLKRNIQLNNLISFNYVYGCTMIFNRRLAEQIGTIPVDAENHDYWVALVASMYKSAFLNEKLICYRQHNTNASGNVVGNNSMVSRIKRLVLSPQREIGALQKRLHMLTLFFQKHHSDLSPANREMLAKYLKAFDNNRLWVCYRILYNRMFKKGFFQTLATFYQVLLFFNKIKAKKHF